MFQLLKKNKRKNFFLYFLYNFYENLFRKKYLMIQLLKLKFDIKNVYINIYDHTNKRNFSERNKIYLRFPFDLRFIKFISNEIKKNINFFIKTIQINYT